MLLKGLTILGATGSVGSSTLDVVTRNPDKFKVVALSANSDPAGLARLCRVHRPAYAAMVNGDAAAKLKIELSDLPTRVLSGKDSLDSIATLPEVDLVMAAIVGAAGLAPTLAAARAGKTILLANKEALVLSGRLFMETVQQHDATLIPVDSEQNAMFQCLPGYRCGDPVVEQGVKRILLTGSGGPFLRTPCAELERVTPEQACNHPNWSMGRKISVDSATMMNKGLEYIETAWLFNCDPAKIETLIHPQSVIHSMVEFVDGSIMAQLGSPDMRIPIAYALGLPDRLESGVGKLDLFQVGNLGFEAPDYQRYPCLQLAYDAMQSGGKACAVLNAANEVAVDAFLRGSIAFPDIANSIAAVLDQLSEAGDCPDLEEIINLDTEARLSTSKEISRRLM